MDYKDIINEMRVLGFPCTYGEFKEEQTPPYTVILFSQSNDFMADNHNYKDIGNYQLELYHNIKHPPSETLIEDKLKELRIPYFKSETPIEREKMYQVVYEIQLI